MRKQYEDLYHQVEDDHWWFLGRRQLVHSLIRNAMPERRSRILEIGCSGGPLIHLLQADGYSDVTGIDISVDAVNICHQNGMPRTFVMDAQNLSFDDCSYDLIIASDVLEHLENTEKALSEWRRVLKPGGYLIVFVPAFHFLWSTHDDVNNHYKRYGHKELRESLHKSGFIVNRSSFWNCLLFVPVVLIRTFRKFIPTQPSQTSDIRPTVRFVNKALYNWLCIENSLLMNGISLPIGVSVMAVAEKSNTAPMPH